MRDEDDPVQKGMLAPTDQNRCSAPVCCVGRGTKPGRLNGAKLRGMPDSNSDRPADTELRCAHRLLTAELLAVGSEITTGETRDTNGGDLARELDRLGVAVTRLVALPDDLASVSEAFRAALGRADLIISSGGLGPTPDDLTREAIAAACGEEPSVDPELAAWLRGLFTRRGLVMPERNLKQAWLIPSARPIPNPNGTAPGWWVNRPDGRILIALPGPPHELQAMWREQVLPELRRRGVGAGVAVRTLRLTQIGESHVAEALGDLLLRGQNPRVATYAKADAVEVRISARDEPGAPARGRSASEIVEATARVVEERFARHVFAHDDETWAEALSAVLGGRTVAAVEIGTAGALAAVIGDAPWFLYDEVIAAGARAGSRDRSLRAAARRARALAGADVGLAVRASEQGGDTQVTVALAIGGDVFTEEQLAFLGGPQGRRRAALAACAALWMRLRQAAAS
jgi:nicotinamide-nucleotide amidase